MRNGNIAADYDNVKIALNKMDKNISEMYSSINELKATVDNLNDWKGIDATAYRAVLNLYGNKISNSLNWLKKLDSVISNHAESLYQRALEDQKTASFR